MTQLNEGTFSEVDEKPAKKKDENRIKIRFSLFFDGTLNNRTNVKEGVNSQAYKDAKSSIGLFNDIWGVGSFENALSNIAKMEEYVNKNTDNYIFATYIEGQGTTNFKADSFQGKALGIAKTGVTQRAKKGLLAVVSTLNRLNKSKIIEELSIDVFGFSRGAAAARNFLHQAMNTKSRGRIPTRSLRQRIESIGFEIDKLEIEFAGLFDTVSSVGLPSNHKRNTQQLHLDAISHAKDVVHLVAAEEHRKNFSLTNTNSVGSKEIYLPGVHSDIGGGYPDNYDESELIVCEGLQDEVEAEKSRLENCGWFKSGQLVAVEPPTYRSVQQNKTWKLQIKERIVKNEYDRIPLHIMAEFARESGIDLKKKLEGRYPVKSQLLLMVLNDLNPYAKERKSKAEDWLGDQEKWNGLRRQFLHVSAHYSGTGMEPRFVNGRRKRLVYEG
ncbi:MAG: DUF2235 domain-containing protein [Gammaproteobacteria bacterium]|nr:DUF2235 domain-containing protein [Gammaproteobacteria bacterium]